jgi:hypothetical protein
MHAKALRRPVICGGAPPRSKPAGKVLVLVAFWTLLTELRRRCI